jgi:hypothetical protein
LLGDGQSIHKLVLGHSPASAFHGGTELWDDLLRGGDHRLRQLEVLLVNDAKIEFCVAFF